MTRGLNHKAGSLLNGAHHHGNLCYTANLLQSRLTTDQSDHWENWVIISTRPPHWQKYWLYNEVRKEQRGLETFLKSSCLLRETINVCVYCVFKKALIKKKFTTLTAYWMATIAAYSCNCAHCYNQLAMQVINATFQSVTSCQVSKL